MRWMLEVFDSIRVQPKKVQTAFVIVIVCIAFGIVDVLNDNSFGTLTTALGTAIAFSAITPINRSVDDKTATQHVSTVHPLNALSYGNPVSFFKRTPQSSQNPLRFVRK